MPNKLHLVHVKSSVLDKAPVASDINYGEIAVNYNSGSTALYIRDHADNIVKFSPVTVDSWLDTGSTNPVANSAITNVIYENEETIAAALNDLESRKADKEYVDEAISGITIDVDDHMDSASTNPVQNKVVKEYIDEAVSSITIDVDSELDSGSTNSVANSAITSCLTNIEYIFSRAVNDLNDRKADKSYVDEAVSGITIDVDMVMDSASTNPVANSAVTITILENEMVVAGALNDLNDKIAITAVTQVGSGNVVTAATVSDKVLTIEKGTISSGDFVPVADFNAHTGNTDIHVTTAQTEQWDESITGVTVNSTPATVTNHVASFSIEGLPAVTSADNGKVLKVVNGVWTLVDPVTVYSGSGTPQQSLGNNGDIYLQTS